MKYYGKENPLVETCEFVVESVSYEGKDGKLLAEGVRPGSDDHMVLEGPIQRSDVVNLNKRTYPRKVWEKQLAEGGQVLQKIAAGGMIGHLEHPKDGTTDLNLASHLVKEARLLEDGVVRGRIVVLKNVNGEKIESIVRAGGRVGISSRGTGSVDDKGMVQEDYQVETWDVVHNPSTPGAHIAPPKADEAAKAVQESTAMDTKKPAVAEDVDHEFSVEQEVFGQKGIDFVKAKSGITDPVSLSNVHYRFFKWARQRGAVDKTLEAAWDSFSKIHPLVTGEAPKAAVPAGAEPSEPAKREPMDGENKAPETKVVPHQESSGNAVATAASAETPNTETKKVEVVETAEGLLEAARGEITKLAAQVAGLTEDKIKLTKDLETSSASIIEAQETAARLQAKIEEQAKSLDKASKTIAALTAVDAAAQVREAIEEAIRSDARLAAFRDSLELQKTPAAVEAKAQAILATLAESANKTTDKAVKPTIAERIRDRASRTVTEDVGLPTKPVHSDDDAAHKVTESVATARTHTGAKSALAAIRKIHEA